MARIKRAIILVGPWKNTQTQLGHLNKLLRDNAAAALDYNAKKLLKLMKSKITRGDIGWEALSPLTAQRKGHYRAYKESGSLKRALKIFRPTKYRREIGIRKGQRNKYGVPLNMVLMIQEFGKIIRPTRARKLAIPLTVEAQRLQRAHGGVGKIPGLFRLKNKNVLVMKREGGGLKILFVLKSKVTVPPRSILRSSMKDMKQKMITQIRKSAELAVKGKYYIR